MMGCRSVTDDKTPREGAHMSDHLPADFHLPGDQENPFAAPETQDEEVSRYWTTDPDKEFQPFKTIWTRPRATVRKIVSVDPTLHVVVLVCLNGIGSCLDRASLQNSGNTMPLSATIVLAIVFGPLAGLFGLWLFSHLVVITGGLLGGFGNRAYVKTALAWATVPSLVTLALWVPYLILLREEMFTGETPDFDSKLYVAVPIMALMVMEFILGFWEIVLVCNTVAEVQGYRSAWQGLLNLILAGLLLMLVFVLIFILGYRMVVGLA